MSDLAIIGAGPAGMSAAIAARKLGLSVTVFDEQPEPGGQIYRNVSQPRSPASGAVFGVDYAMGLPLVRAFRDSRSGYQPRATVWRIGADGLSWTAPQGGGDQLAARVLVAGSAIERPFSIPGWTLPGVMTAGAAQILLKISGTVADGAVSVGSGPLLYLVACQYLQAGAQIAAIWVTPPPTATACARPFAPKQQSGRFWTGFTVLALNFWRPAITLPSCAAAKR